MKVVAIVASPRRDGNTTDMANHALEYLQKKGVETQVHNLFDFKITPCGIKCNVECYEHVPNSGRICPVDNEDDLLKLIRIVKENDSVILATPCYGFDVPAHLKAYLERSELKEFDDKVVGIIAIASLGGTHLASTITSNLIQNSNSTIAGWSIITSFYLKKGQALKNENNKKSVEKLAEKIHSALQERK